MSGAPGTPQSNGAAGRVLNVGGGSKSIELPPHFRGWEHVLLDINPSGGADLVCDARTLREAVGAGSFDAVYCSHNLEHYYRHDVDKVLQGFLHALKAGGFAEIRVPDIDELIKLMAKDGLDLEQEIYKSPAGPISAHDMIYGYGPEIEASGQDFYAHKTGFTRVSLARALRAGGFGEIYFAPPLSVLELHAFAFKTTASAAQRAAFGLGEAAADAADPVEALYQRAVAAFSAGNWGEAAATAGRALAAEPQLPALHYLLGCCRLAQEQHTAALQSFASCLALRPQHPLAAQTCARQALCRARVDLANGRSAAIERLAPEHVQAVSVLICSAKPERAARAEAMYHRLLVELPHEVILIGDARSLAEGYNRALARARHGIVVFAHDDVEILSPDFAARLLTGMRRHDLVGIAGTRKLVGGAWHFAGYPQLVGQIGMPAGDGGYVVTLYEVAASDSGGLQALDGVLLATRRETALRLGFDAATFDGWHLYDLDFSLRAAQAGLDCGSCNDILAVHDSPGRYGEAWSKYAQRFQDKHRGRVQPLPGAIPAPDFVSLQVRSAEEWRLMTQHLIAA